MDAVYDAVLGRFLQPHPLVQDVTDLQALNRYSYVNNNPLSFTDPSGYFFKKIFKAIGKAIKAVVNFVAENWKRIITTAVQWVTTYFFGPTVGGFAKNFTSTILNGGSLTSALKSGFRGALISSVTQGLSNSIDNYLDIPSENVSFLEKAKYYSIKTVSTSVIQGSTGLLLGIGWSVGKCVGWQGSVIFRS